MGYKGAYQRRDRAAMLTGVGKGEESVSQRRKQQQLLQPLGWLRAA